MRIAMVIMMYSSQNDGLMYKMVAFAVFIVLVALIMLISVSSAREAEQEDALQTSTDVSSSSSIDSSPVSTSPDSDSLAQASEASASTTSSAPSESSASVSVDAPDVTLSDDYAAFLAQYPDTVLALTEDAGQDYIDKLVFLGDSTTYGLRAYKMLKGEKDTTQVWTPASGTLTLSQAEFATIVYPETNEQITIKEAIKKKQPEYLVITLGVNGVSFMGEDYFKSEYKKIIETVQTESPDTKIICQSIFPVAENYEYLGSINNEKIAVANRWIVEVAAECGVKFLDTYSALVGEDGYLPENYQNGDGMHLNTTSFTIELNCLRTHALLDDEEE